ncbi:MAG: hypothetical protein O6761_08950, partial [Thaumarchaeota archaeon]|nr:hypothetical protein [Nitrososphaerota archaeon]
ENIGELGYQQLMEVYVPISLSSDEIDGVIETYTRLDFVNQTVEKSNFILFSTVASATMITIVSGVFPIHDS